MSKNTQEKQQDKVRLGILDKLLGRDKASAITGELDTLSQELDRLGLKRKSYEQLASKGVLEDLHTGIAAVLSKVQDNVPDEVVSEVIAVAMGRLLQGDVVPEEEVMAEDEEESEAVADEDMVEEEFRSLKGKEWLAQLKENNQRLDDLATETHDIVKDMGDMVDLLIPVLKAFPEASKLINGAKDFDSRLANLEKQIKMKPRQASKEDSTIATDAETKNMKAQNLEDVPELFRGAFTGGQ